MRASKTRKEQHVSFVDMMSQPTFPLPVSLTILAILIKALLVLEMINIQRESTPKFEYA